MGIETEIFPRQKIVREFNAQTKKNFVLVISGLKGGQNIYVFSKYKKAVEVEEIKHSL